MVLFTGAFAQPGVLDQTFGVGGKVMTYVGRMSNGFYFPNALVAQPDGKIILGGGSANDSTVFTRPLIIRYNTNGSLDTTFGIGGSIVYQALYEGEINSIVLQPDGKILATGYGWDSSSVSFVIRLKGNGKYDSTFGINGVKIIIPKTNLPFDYYNNIFIRPNNSIFLGGIAYDSTNRINYRLLQFNPNGTPDNTFGVNGEMIINALDSFSQYISEMQILKSGKIIARFKDITPSNYKNGVIRFNVNGSVDSSFGVNGKASVSSGIRTSYLHGINVDSNGNIFLLGNLTDSIKTTNFTLVCFDSSGSLKSNFGINGKLSLPYSCDFKTDAKYKFRPDGKIYLITRKETADSLLGWGSRSDFALLLYNKNGTIDDSFGRRGIIITDFDNNEVEYPTDFLIQPDGKIIAVGLSTNVNDYKGNFVLARYESNARIYYNSLIASTFLDKNGNGIKDTNEPLFSKGNLVSLKAWIDTIRSIFYADKISVDLDTGTYVTRFIPYSPAYNVVPASHVTSNSTYFHDDSVSFAVQPVPGQRDVAINLISLNAARPGFYLRYQLVYSNQGTDTVSNGVIKLLKSNKLTYQSSTVAPNSIVGDTLIWNFADLKPLQDSSIFLDFYVKAPPIVNSGDSIQSMAIITTNKPDLTPADDTSRVKQIATSAYDPNDKTENHGGKITTVQVTNGDYLQYTIRFQNTGNDTAFNVYIRDTLDNKLDWNTMQILTASHSYQMTMTDGNKCLFTLRNVNLVDSTTNEPASHGYIVYKVKPKPTVVLGDTIKNTAAIYFDYNLPVLTNTETTLVINEVLPLRLLSFTAKKENKTNLLNWTTTNEINVDHFDIERSRNGREFSRIGSVKAGQSNYYYTDNSPLTTANYYRLKMMDKDGKYEYSPIRLLTINNSQLPITIYPNPARDKVTVTHPAANTAAQLQLTDMTGRILRRTKVAAEVVQATMNIKGLPAGKYNLTWSNGIVSHTQPLVIE